MLWACYWNLAVVILNRIRSVLSWCWGTCAFMLQTNPNFSQMVMQFTQITIFLIFYSSKIWRIMQKKNFLMEVIYIWWEGILGSQESISFAFFPWTANKGKLFKQYIQSTLWNVFLLLTEKLLPFFVQCIEEGTPDVQNVSSSALLALLYNNQKVQPPPPPPTPTVEIKSENAKM